jgi:inner membrane protein
MVGGNLPDVDLLWSMPPFSGDKLGYLLHHRGYTHTLLGCAALAALLYAATLIWLRFRGWRTSVQDRLHLGLFALLAVLLHLCMDALNSYGVHPFWPWNNRWYYGDAVFIVEPLYWIAVAPLLFTLRTAAARAGLALVLVVASAAILFVHGFAWQWWAVPALALALAVTSRPLSSIRACVSSAVLILLVTLTFVTAGAVASHRVNEAARVFAGFQTLDHVLTPSPAQPFCWDVLLLQQRDDQYVVRHAQLQIAATSACTAVLRGAGTAPMRPVPQTAASQAAANGLRWSGEFAMSRTRLIGLVQADCAARELMQFVRAPYATETASGWLLGDLRFDAERGAGLAQIIVSRQDARCRYRVPWIPPRAELLDR